MVYSGWEGCQALGDVTVSQRNLQDHTTLIVYITGEKGQWFLFLYLKKIKEYMTLMEKSIYFIKSI